MDLNYPIPELKPKNFPPLRSGDTVKVGVNIKEGERQRTQSFQGTVLRVKEGGIRSSFTVRRVSYGIGVERTFFFYSPNLEKIEVLRHGRARRARLYYLRQRTGKAARLKEKRVLVAAAETVEEAPPTEPQTMPPTEPQAETPTQ